MRKIISWALYDWANSAFATSVMAGFFPLFFKQYWSAGTDPSVSTFNLGLANSLSSIAVAVLAPVLGAISDTGGLKKKMLFIFAFLGIAMTCALGLVAKGDWLIAVWLYVIAVAGFLGGNVFYDSLLVNISEPGRMNFVSALGYGMGYLGGGILFALMVWMSNSPESFGLSSQESAIKLSFVLVGVWWAVFSIPIMLFVDEPSPRVKKRFFNYIKDGFSQLSDTFAEARRLRVVMLFLVAYWLYIDGVDTIVRMAVDYGMSLGFDPSSLIVALLITQFIGFPAAIVMGKAGDWFGTKRTILFCIAVYTLVTIYASFMTTVAEFYALAVVIGLVQGGLQSLSRSYYTVLIPHNKSGEYFGIYNMMGKFAAVIGPLMIGTISLLTGNHRIAILSIIILFIIGGFLLSRVDEQKGRRLAEKL